MIEAPTVQEVGDVFIYGTDFGWKWTLVSIANNACVLTTEDDYGGTIYQSYPLNPALWTLVRKGGAA